MLKSYINGFVEDYGNSIANAMELPLSSTKLSISCIATTNLNYVHMHVQRSEILILKAKKSW